MIVADLSDLENAESQISDNPSLQTLLMEGLLKNSDEVQTYATTNLAVEAPVDKKRSASGREATATQEASSKKQALSGPYGKPLSLSHNPDSNGDNPGPEQLQHTYNNQPCPACNAEMCKEKEPGAAADLSIRQPDFSGLPIKILKRIFQFTSLSDRCSIMQCCKRFMRISIDEEVISSQVLVQLQGKLPDIVFPTGAAMSEVLEAKVVCSLKNTSSVVKQVLAYYLKLAPSLCIHRWPQGIYGITSLTTFPDDRIVAGNIYQKVSVWSMERDRNMSPKLSLQGFSRVVTCVATLSDCLVFSGSSEGELTIWNVKKIHDVNTYKVHTDMISSIETLPDRWLYSGSHDKSIKVWTFNEKGLGFHRLDLSVHGKVSCLKVLPDGQLFAGTLSGEIKYWETTKSHEAPLPREWQAHNDEIMCIEMFPNSRLLTHSSRNEIKIWNLKNHDLSCISYINFRASLLKRVTCSKVSPDGQLVVCTNASNLSTVEIFTFGNSRPDLVCSIQTNDAEMKGIVFLQNGQMVTASKDGVLRVWDYPRQFSCWL